MNRTMLDLATALIRVALPARKGCEMEDVRSILVIGAGGIGDVLMKTPMLSTLRSAFPHALITMFTSPGAPSSILGSDPSIDEIVTVGSGESLDTGRPLEIIRYLRMLRGRRFDMTLTTYIGLSFRGAVFSYVIGAPIRVGYNKNGQGLLYNCRVEVDGSAARHTVEHNLDLLRALGIEVGCPRLAVHLREDELKAADVRLLSHGVDKTEFLVGMHVGSGPISFKRWSPERFGKVAARLEGGYRARVMLVGGKEEIPLVEQVAAFAGSSPIDFVGKLSIRETAAVISRCDLFVSNDTGLMHVAVALGVPVVAIFGPTDPRCTGPYSDRSAVVTPAIDCAPCYDGWRVQCDTRACLDAISVDDVVAAARDLISGWEKNAGENAI